MMLEYAKRLVKRGHEVDVIALNRNLTDGERLSPYEQYEGITINRLSFIDTKWKPIPLCRPGRLLHLFKNCDLVHTHDIRLLLETAVLAKLLYRKPLIVGTYGFIFHKQSNSVFKKFVFDHYFKKIFRVADRLLAISRQDYEKVERDFSPDKLQIIDGGIDFLKFSKVVRAPEKKRLLYFGRLDHHKRIDLLFKVMAHIDRTFELHMVYGSAKQIYLSELMALAAQLNLGSRIHWHGQCSEEVLFDHFAKAKFVMLPSQYEGFGLTTLEAMAAGVIPIANNIDAFRNVISNGVDGYIVDYTRPQAVASLLEKLEDTSEDILTRLSSAAREKAATYDWDKKVDLLVEVYSQLLQKEKAVEKQEVVIQ